MKLCRFDEGKLGLVEGDNVFDVSDALKLIPETRYPFPKEDLLIVYLSEICEAARTLKPTARALPLGEVRFLSPVARPAKIIGAPINYQEHIDETVKDVGISHGRVVPTIREWGLFLKSPTSLIGFGEEIVLRRPDRRNDHECELAVVIGRHCSKVDPADALSYVAGYAIGLDMTVRGPEFQCWRKSVDTYSVLGPWLVTADEIPDPGNLDLSLKVNGASRQNSNTRRLVLDVPGLIAWASSMYALLPGDIIMTGTPAGVGPVLPGDLITASIEGIGDASIRVAGHYE